MGAQGRNSSGVIRKQSTDSSLAVGTHYRPIHFLHEATAGDSVINLLALNAPSGAGSYVAPSGVDIQAAKLFFRPAALSLYNGESKKLKPFIDYTISSANIITLNAPALGGEIFEGVIESVQKTGLQALDARFINATGVLLAGETDINVGEPFKVNANPLFQRGDVKLTLGALGNIQYRNVGNADDLTGNYREVDRGDGMSQLLRLNTPVLVDTPYSVEGTRALIEGPSDSLSRKVETLQGQIDALVSTLAIVAGVPESTFQTAPNQPDLKQFGDTVLNNIARLVVLENLLPYESGTWSPTVELVTNMTSVSNIDARYVRIADTVWCWGSCQVDVVTTGSQSHFRFTLPVATDLSTAGQLTGYGSRRQLDSGHNLEFTIQADGSGERANFFGESNQAGSPTLYWNFMYRV